MLHNFNHLYLTDDNLIKSKRASSLSSLRFLIKFPDFNLLM